ncbi:MAG: hypothetical protein SF339_00845 [Blastocatellia bacterium]|nr:hypothetical protein [Blastocatellia bacterium]
MCGRCARWAICRSFSASATPRAAMAASTQTFQEDFGDRALPGYVIHPGGQGGGRQPLVPRVAALPFSAL